jgi:hypothetical protein
MAGGGASPLPPRNPSPKAPELPGAFFVGRTITPFVLAYLVAKETARSASASAASWNTTNTVSPAPGCIGVPLSHRPSPKAESTGFLRVWRAILAAGRKCDFDGLCRVNRTPFLLWFSRV